MPFDIVVTREFSAAHALRFPGGRMEPIHGHNWQVAITVSSERLDDLGVVMDFHELERLIDEIILPLHNSHLNLVQPFDDALNPTAENVAFHVAQRLRLPGTARLTQVAVWETAACCAVYRPRSP